MCKLSPNTTLFLNKPRTFAGIPSLVTRPKVTFQVPYNIFEKQLNDLIDMGLVIEPDFQRGHVWAQQQQTNYIEFLLGEGASARDIYINHPDWGKFKCNDNFVLVDGLQRITALKAFLNNTITAFGCYFCEFEDEPSYTQLTLNFNITLFKTKNEIIKWYIGHNSGGTPHTVEELNRVRLMIEI